MQNGAFGACLMREPALVGDCVAAIKAAVHIPVTVKCRIGVDEQDPETALFTLAEAVAAAGVDALFVHARKAWLKGLSPRENRDVPPLDYTLVYRLKAAWTALPIAVNGGIGSLAEARDHLAHVDGVMLGRAAYRMPDTLLGVDGALFGEQSLPVVDGFAALCRLPDPMSKARAPCRSGLRRCDRPVARPFRRACRCAGLSAHSVDLKARRSEAPMARRWISPLHAIERPALAA